MDRNFGGNSADQGISQEGDICLTIVNKMVAKLNTIITTTKGGCIIRSIDRFNSGC